MGKEESGKKKVRSSFKKIGVDIYFEGEDVVQDDYFGQENYLSQ